LRAVSVAVVVYGNSNSLPRLFLAASLRRSFRSNLWVWVSLLSVFVHGSPARAAGLQHLTPWPSVLSAQFAAADLDGDGLPDVASIQPGQTNEAGNVSYWVELQLSSFGWKSIRIVGPPGGLRIRAVDVNKDCFVDLVFVAALSKQPAAILITDGKGNFSQVPPSAFPDAFKSSSGPLISDAVSIRALNLPIPQRPASRLRINEMPGFGSVSHSVPLWNSVFVFTRFLASRRERAPPLQLSCI
jgi:hypothetical protein